MATVIFSRLAELDLDAIDEYTQRTWGEAQADQYLAKLEQCFSSLAISPGLGRACPDIRPGLQRMEQGSHVVFYRQTASGIAISRILHQGMLAIGRKFPR